jgi:hypothetical protein
VKEHTGRIARMIKRKINIYGIRSGDDSYIRHAFMYIVR